MGDGGRALKILLTIYCTTYWFDYIIRMHMMLHTVKLKVCMCLPNKLWLDYFAFILETDSAKNFYYFFSTCE